MCDRCQQLLKQVSDNENGESVGSNAGEDATGVADVLDDLVGTTLLSKS